MKISIESALKLQNNGIGQYIKKDGFVGMISDIDTEKNIIYANIQFHDIQPMPLKLDSFSEWNYTNDSNDIQYFVAWMCCELLHASIANSESDQKSDSL